MDEGWERIVAESIIDPINRAWIDLYYKEIPVIIQLLLKKDFKVETSSAHIRFPM